MYHLIIRSKQHTTKQSWPCLKVHRGTTVKHHRNSMTQLPCHFLSFSSGIKNCSSSFSLAISFQICHRLTYLLMVKPSNCIALQVRPKIAHFTRGGQVNESYIWVLTRMLNQTTLQGMSEPKPELNQRRKNQHTG